MEMKCVDMGGEVLAVEHSDFLLVQAGDRISLDITAHTDDGLAALGRAMQISKEWSEKRNRRKRSESFEL